MPFFLNVEAQDSISFQSKDTLRTDISDTVTVKYHSPTRAALLSAVFPGMGQIYNRKYWKLPLVYGGLGTLGYLVVHYNKLYQQYHDAYVQYYKYGNTEILYTLPKFNMSYSISRQLEFYKKTYRRYRDMDILLFCGVYMLNIIDATVDGYLLNYDISDKLSMHVEPALVNGSLACNPSLGLKLSFDFR